MRLSAGRMVAVILCLIFVACSKQPSASTQAIAPAQTVTPSVRQSPAPSTASAAAAQIAPASTPSSVSGVQGTQNLTATDVTQGPFAIGGQSFTFVKHVQSIGEPKPENESTVEWWELRDASGKATYREQYGVSYRDGSFDETEDVGARELKTKFGQGILVEGQGLPSAPNTGSWVQVFGLFDAKLVPLSSPISTEGEFLEEAVDSFQPSVMFRGQQPQIVSRDVLKFRMWTGNFNLEYPVAIDWIQAKLHPAWTCPQRTGKGPGSACRYKVEVEPAPRSEMSFVRLFNEPDEGGVPKHVVIKPESKIEFVEAQAPISWISDEHNTTFGLASDSRPSAGVWLHIRIDGQDGWISGEEDFEAVGLPEAG